MVKGVSSLLSGDAIHPGPSRAGAKFLSRSSLSLRS